MKPSEKSELIGKFWEGNTTRDEEEMLFEDISPEPTNDANQAYFHFIAKVRNVEFNKKEEVWNHILVHDRRRKRMIYLSLGVAASILLLVSLSLITLNFSYNKNIEDQLASNNIQDYYYTFGTDSENSPTLYINGCRSSSDYHTVIRNINPKCIQHVNMINEPGKSGNKNGIVEVWLKGRSDELFSICEGTLYFYQDGEIKSISIEDECSPNLLVDCHEIPLSEISELKPQQIKSIELTNNPLNCNGQLNGEFIVLESK